MLLVPLGVVLAGAWSYRWVQEDAFIDFRIIGNLLAGNGPVFNVGERVEVYTDPLWLGLLAGVHVVLPGVPLAWLAVVLGMTATACGVVLAGRGMQRLSDARTGDGGAGGVTLPIGLVMFSVVAGVWEFATSGLEMGLAFAWIGLTFWLLVREEERRRSAVCCAFVAGLGPLIRPELALMSVVWLGALAVVVAADGWRGPTSVLRRYVAPVVAAAAVPVLYEVWRMAYFALVVPNTALAKSAGASWWPQGLTYVWNFVAPYTLWLPFALAVPLVGPRIWRWARARDTTGVAVAVAPLVAAGLDLVYVARVGGDYQHARLVLPAFMASCLTVTVVVRQLRSLAVVPVLGIAVWSVACAGQFRYATGGLLRTDHGITDERSVWIGVSGSAHPVTAADYHNHLGRDYRMLASLSRAAGRQVLVIDTRLASPRLGTAPDVQPARTALPVSLVVNTGAIGVTGYLSGPYVYVFDTFSLADPVGSHVEVTHHGRPGHEKSLGPAWMIARFGTRRTALPGGVTPAQVDAARAALSCAPLRTYLEAITAPWGWSRALSNVTHALGFTTMTFSARPRRAEAELCR